MNDITQNQKVEDGLQGNRQLSEIVFDRVLDEHEMSFEFVGTSQDIMADINSSFSLEVFERLDDLSYVLEVKDLFEIIDEFILEMPLLFEKMRNAIESQNSQKIAEIAHRLKGSFANMGSTYISGYCADIEYRAQDNCMDGLEDIFAHVTGNWQNMSLTLHAYKNKFSKQPTL